jgi:hypothetical protein
MRISVTLSLQRSKIIRRRTCCANDASRYAIANATKEIYRLPSLAISTKSHPFLCADTHYFTVKKTLAETLATLISLIGTNQEQDHGNRTL